MSLKRVSPLALRSLLAMTLGFAVVVLVNQGGGELADASGFPPGGEARLAWDLGWVFLAGMFAAWVVAKLAPCARRMHALVFFALMLGLAVLAVIRLGDGWPGWFSAGILLAVPLQVGLAAVLAVRGRKHA